jgi:hypothetical protein
VTHDLTIGTFTPSFLIELARRDGRFADAGLTVSEVAVTSSPQQFRSLAQGEYDLVFTNPDNVIAYQFLSDNPLKEKMSLRILGGIDRGLGLGLYRGPEVAEEVHAGVLGVDVATSGFAFIAYEILARHGVATSDMTIENLGATPKRVASLVNGGCDYTILNAGNDLIARAQGCSLVAPVTDIGPYLGTVLAALRTPDKDQVAAQDRCRDVLADTVTSALSGFRDADVIALLASLLGLSDEGAREHLRCIKNLSTGLVPGISVDTASINTIVELRQRHRPDDELAVALQSLDSLIDADVLV